MKRLWLILILIMGLIASHLVLTKAQFSPNYFWIKVYYSDSCWDTLTDFVLDDNKIIGLGKISFPFESKLPTSAGRALAVMIFDLKGELEKFRLYWPPVLLNNKESALFGYRIFKEDDGYLLFAGSNPTISREKYVIGDNGFNHFYVIKIDKQLEVKWIKSYYRPATDLRDVVFCNGFYYVLLFDLSRNYSGTVGILKINKDGEIVSANSLFASDYWLKLLLVETRQGKMFLVGEANYRIGMSPYNDELIICELDPQTLNIKWKKTYGKMIRKAGKGVVINNDLYVPLVVYKKNTSWEANLEIWKFNFEGEVLERKRIFQKKNADYDDIYSLYSFNDDFPLYLTCSINGNNILKIENDNKIIGYYVGRRDTFGWIVKLEKDKFGNFVFGYPILFPSHHNHPLLNVVVNDFVLGYLNQNLEIPYGENEWYYRLQLPEKAEIIEEKIPQTETSQKIKEKPLTFFSAPLPTYTIYDFDGKTVKYEILTESKIVINLNWSQGGKIEPAETILKYGSSITYRFIPEKGYRIKDVIVDGVSVGPVDSYTFEKVEVNHTLRVIFEKIYFKITGKVTPAEGGWIQPGIPWEWVEYEGTRTFTILPAKGYRIKDILIDGKSVGAVSSYTFSNVLEDHTIEAIFEPISFTITASAGIGGTISPSGKIEIRYWERKTFIIIPDKGYRIKDILIDGKSVGAVSSYTFSNVLEDHTIEAIFEPISFTITASAGIGGTISPSGKIVVNYGESKRFIIIPDKGYKIKDILIDGKSVGPVSVYTFSNIDSDHKIEAVFEKEKIVINLQIGNKIMFVNYTPKEIDVPPVIIEGRTLLPIRWVGEPLGAEVGWDGEEKKVTVTLKSTTIELWVGKNIARVNGNYTLIDPNNPKVVPMIITGRTMLPVRFIAENLGCKVDWDGITKTVTITYPKD